MNTRFLITNVIVVLGLTLTVGAAGMNLKNGNFLLASEDLIVQVDRSGDAVDGLFPPVAWVTAVGVDPAGSLVVGGYERFTVSDEYFQRIYRLDNSGRVLSTNVPPMDFDTFAVAPNGDILLGSYTVIVRTDSAFNFLDVFSVPAAPGSAPSIGGIAFGPHDEVYVVAFSYNPPRTSLIHRLDARGNLLQSLGPFELDIHGLAVDTNGHVFCATIRFQREP